VPNASNDSGFSLRSVAGPDSASLISLCQQNSQRASTSFIAHILKASKTLCSCRRKRKQCGCTCPPRNHFLKPPSVAAPHFTFPISKEICLLVQPFRNPSQVTLNASDVRHVNRGTITRADSQLYAPFNSGAVQALFDKINKQTKRPRRVLLRHGRVVIE